MIALVLLWLHTRCAALFLVVEKRSFFPTNPLTNVQVRLCNKAIRRDIVHGKEKYI